MKQQNPETPREKPEARPEGVMEAMTPEQLKAEQLIARQTAEENLEVEKHRNKLTALARQIATPDIPKPESYKA